MFKSENLYFEEYNEKDVISNNLKIKKRYADSI